MGCWKKSLFRGSGSREKEKQSASAKTIDVMTEKKKRETKILGIYIV